MKRVLIMGAGGIGKRHIRSFLATKRARVSVCEIDPAKLQEMSSSYNIEKAYADFAAVPLSEFDLAVIAAPAHVHVAVGQQLAEAGVPFLTEKPLSVTMNGVDKLLEMVESKRLPVRVGFFRRSLRRMQKIKAELESGSIGKFRMAYINFSAPHPKGRPDYQSTYYAKQAMGGGAILDCASHLVDMILWMLGPVRQVSSMYDRLVLEGVECEDSLLMNLRLASGAMINIAINQFQMPCEEKVEFIGTEANLRITGSWEGSMEMARDNSGRWDALPPVKELLAHIGHFEAMYVQQAQDFLDTLEGASPPLCTLPEARENLRICLAAKDSYRTHRIIEL